MRGESGDAVGKRKWWKTGMAGVWAIALGTVVVHVATGWRYGFNRDELMLLEDARHLAWGYVQYPPMTAFFGWMALKLFGTSLVGFRFFAAVVQALALVLTGMMAKEIAGGGKSENRKWKIGNSDNGKSENGNWKVENREYEIGESRDERAAAKAHSPFEAQGKQEWLCHGDWAAMVAAGAGVPFCLGGGALMQYISFDYVCWVLVAYGMVKVLSEVRTAKNGCATWWVVVGAGIGLGMMAKYTMGFLVAGVVAGVVFTEARRFLRSGWLWLGVLVSVAVWAPNVWWQWQREFPSAEFLQFLHTRDVSTGMTDGFLVGQLELTLLAFPLAAAGLWFYLFAKEGKPYRAMGWMYLVPFVMLLAMKGRDYYLAPAYPMLYAAGAVWIERQWRVASDEWRESRSEPKTHVQRRPVGHPVRVDESVGSNEAMKQREIGNSKLEIRNSSDRAGSEPSNKTVKVARWMKKWLPAMLVVDAVVAGCVALPIMPVNSRWWNMAAQVDTVLPEELGWEELTATVAGIRDTLPVADRARLGILARNYGEMGALNLYGERYGLPRAISGVNSSWERGYGDPAPETVIAVGYTREFLEDHFASCELVGHPWNRYGVATEETIEDPDIFVCRGLKENWREFWKKVKLFA